MRLDGSVVVGYCLCLLPASLVRRSSAAIKQIRATRIKNRVLPVHSALINRNRKDITLITPMLAREEAKLFFGLLRKCRVATLPKMNTKPKVRYSQYSAGRESSGLESNRAEMVRSTNKSIPWILPVSNGPCSHRGHLLNVSRMIAHVCILPAVKTAGNVYKSPPTRTPECYSANLVAVGQLRCCCP